MKDFNRKIKTFSIAITPSLKGKAHNPKMSYLASPSRPQYRALIRDFRIYIHSMDAGEKTKETWRRTGTCTHKAFLKLTLTTF